VLDLDQPIVAVEGQTDALNDLERKIAKFEHAIILSKFRRRSGAAAEVRLVEIAPSAAYDCCPF
jgi:hypothetical protein